MTDILEYLTSGKGMLILGLFVSVMVIYNKVKTKRQFKRPSKKKKT